MMGWVPRATMKSSLAALAPITSRRMRTIIGSGQVRVPSGVNTRTRLPSYRDEGVRVSMISRIFSSVRIDPPEMVSISAIAGYLLSEF